MPLSVPRRYSSIDRAARFPLGNCIDDIARPECDIIVNRLGEGIWLLKDHADEAPNFLGGMGVTQADTCASCEGGEESKKLGGGRKILIRNLF
jgi:hypothetical protein